jgi:hypothetical protein
MVTTMSPVAPVKVSVPLTTEVAATPGHGHRRDGASLPDIAVRLRRIAFWVAGDQRRAIGNDMILPSAGEDQLEGEMTMRAAWWDQPGRLDHWRDSGGGRHLLVFRRFWIRDEAVPMSVAENVQLEAAVVEPGSAARSESTRDGLPRACQRW